jgi:hypothetical protein
VQEAAVEALAKLSEHGDDLTFLHVIEGRHPQAVRAAAVALKGSPRDDAATQARAVWRRWSAQAIDSERDVRVALLEAAGDSADKDVPLNPRPPVPAEAVRLALGAEERLRVTLDRRVAAARSSCASAAMWRRSWRHASSHWPGASTTTVSRGTAWSTTS